MDKYEKDSIKKDNRLKPTKASGAVHNDADFRLTDEWLVENKYKNKKTVWMSVPWWEKIEKQAIMRNRKPALIFKNPQCDVVYCKSGDLDITNTKCIIRHANEPRNKFLKNDVFTKHTIATRDADMVYIIYYVPLDLYIVDYDDFISLTEV